MKNNSTKNSRMKKTNLARRSFLTQCALLSAAGVASPYASFGSLSMAAAAAQAPAEYRAMVCIYLVGGNDLNMMVPNDDSNYELYQQLRDTLALDRNTLLPITSSTNGVSTNYALHSSLSGMQQLYNDGHLAFVANNGALVEPTTAASYQARSVRLPPKIASHYSQMDFVQAGLPFAGERRNGWAGRIADMFQSAGSTAPLNLSFTGDNLWQRGADSSAYGMVGSRVKPLFNFRGSAGSVGNSRKETLKVINELNNPHLLASEYGRILQGSLELSAQLREGANQQEIELQTVFPSTRLGSSLSSVARLINARIGMQMPQQNFYVSMGGWDQHDDLLSRHNGTLRELDGALSAFYEALVEMGLQDQVTTFTNHEFGRTLSSNGSGSDHAWGGHQIVMGGAVKGGEVYGAHPVFSPDDPQFIQARNWLVPSTSTDQLSATIAKWFGDFTESQLVDIFPNLANFNTKTLDFI